MRKEAQQVADWLSLGIDFSYFDFDDATCVRSC